MKTITSVRIDAEIHKLAVANGLNLSQTLEEALNIKLAMPNTEDHIIEDIAQTKQRLTMLETELKDFQGYKDEETFKQKMQERKQDEELIVKARAKMLANKITSEQYNKLLRSFAAKHSVEFSQVVRIAESRGVVKNANKS